MFLGLNLLPEANMQRIPDRGRAVRRVVLRTLKLLFWGILLQGHSA